MTDTKLATASVMDGSIAPSYSGFYMPTTLDNINRATGNSPEKLVVPKDYHQQIQMCYDFYTRGGMAGTVIDRLAELSVTDIRNGKTKGEEASTYYDVCLLHRGPSHVYRFLRQMALEYFITGMVLPRVDWETVLGADIHPDLTPNREYYFPVFDIYPPNLVQVFWQGWGQKQFFLKLPSGDVKIIKSHGGKTKEQQLRYNMLLQYYPTYVDMVNRGADLVPITDADPILRKEVSITPYPTPYLSKVLEALVFKQQLRRMDFGVAARIINAILLIQEGDKDFPITEDNDSKSRLDALKQQINARANNPAMMERVFMLFSNHTTKLSWITPDVEALLNQDKYRQANEEISEGLGFPRILIVGESRNSGASELSTWAIQPQMEELRTMLLEWLQPIYEEAAERNKFKNTPIAAFTPIKLQDFVKIAAIFAQIYREGNMSRTTRDQMVGLDFDTELELMNEELKGMKELPKEFPEMPYNIQVVPGTGGIGGRPNQVKGGRPTGTQDRPVTKKNSGVTVKGAPTSRNKTTKSPDAKTKAEVFYAEAGEDIELMSDDEVVDLIDRIAQERGFIATLETIGLE